MRSCPAIDFTAEQKAAAIQAVLDHGMTPKEASTAAASGKLPGGIGEELEPFAIPEYAVLDLARDFDFVATLAAELAAESRTGKGASWIESAELASKSA